MTSVIVFFAYPIMLHISTRKFYQQSNKRQKFYQRSYTIILTDLLNAINKMLGKISFYKHLTNIQKYYGTVNY